MMRLVSTTALRFRSRPVVPFLSDSFDLTCHIAKYVIWIFVFVAFANPIDRCPGSILFQLKPLEVLKANDNRERASLLFDDDGLLGVVNLTEEVAEVRSSIPSRDVPW
jgi:hypothetical protein